LILLIYATPHEICDVTASDATPPMLMMFDASMSDYADAAADHDVTARYC